MLDGRVPVSLLCYCDNGVVGCLNQFGGVIILSLVARAGPSGVLCEHCLAKILPWGVGGPEVCYLVHMDSWLRGWLS